MNYIGGVNGHIVGRVLKEAVRRATVVIAKERMIFEAKDKLSYNGTMDDVFTSADTKAQAIYLRTFEECFPLCGVIGEENNLWAAPKDGCSAYFTVDPLDGTKAYVRRQSHGVATMVAMVDGGEVISAYIGDINTEEVYGYRPDSDKVFRITKLDSFEELQPGKRLSSLSRGYCMIREPLEEYSGSAQDFITSFKSYEILGSSIGTWFARLWKQEISALVLEPNWETPWDSTPVIGISLKLGYVFLRPVPGGWEEYTPEIVREKKKRNHEMVVIHRNNLHHLNLKS